MIVFLRKINADDLKPISAFLRFYSKSKTFVFVAPQPQSKEEKLMQKVIKRVNKNADFIFYEEDKVDESELIQYEFEG